MAEELGRIIRRKRIKLPDGNTCDIPVIYQITFADPNDRGQDSRYTLDNTTDSDRTVRVASIPGDGAPTDESGQGGDSGDPKSCLQVERIDRFKLLDAADRGWETFPAPDNKTIQEPPDAPPYFTTHQRTHIIKYVAQNDDGSDNQSIWIKSELIDQINFGDAAERGQETQFTLLNPSEDNPIDGLHFGTDDDGKPTISVDKSVEEITSGVGGFDEGDEPVRTDPFQNIVDWSAKPLTVEVGWEWDGSYHSVGIPTPPSCASPGDPGVFSVISATDSDAFGCGWSDETKWTLFHPVDVENPKYNWTGIVSVNPLVIHPPPATIGSALQPQPISIPDSGIAEHKNIGRTSCSLTVELYAILLLPGNAIGYYIHPTPALDPANRGIYANGYLIHGAQPPSGYSVTISGTMGKLIYMPDLVNHPERTIEMECYSVKATMFANVAYQDGAPTATISALYKRKGAKDPTKPPPYT